MGNLSTMPQHDAMDRNALARSCYAKVQSSSSVGLEWNCALSMLLTAPMASGLASNRELCLGYAAREKRGFLWV